MQRSASCTPQRYFRFQASCMITVCNISAAREYVHPDRARFLDLTVWPGIGGNLDCVQSVAQHNVGGSQGAERVFGLVRIIHSPLKRIGESHRLWWVVSWCLFHIARTRLFVSQPGCFRTTTVPLRAPRVYRYWAGEKVEERRRRRRTWTREER